MRFDFKDDDLWGDGDVVGCFGEADEMDLGGVNDCGLVAFGKLERFGSSLTGEVGDSRGCSEVSTLRGEDLMLGFLF